MTRCRTARALCAAAVLGAAVRAPARADNAVDLEAARKQFTTSCGVCHTVEPNAPPRQGPNLRTVYGRPAASLPDFNYSEALRTSGFVWDEAALDAWIENAQEKRPGVLMMYRQADPDKRKLVIAYLKSLSGQ